MLKILESVQSLARLRRKRLIFENRSTVYLGICEQRIEKNQSFLSSIVEIIKRLVYGVFILLLLPSLSWANSWEDIPLQVAHIHPTDKLSLQRGAKLYINYCSGCHSLNFMRYNTLAQGIGLVDKHSQIDKNLLKENLIFTGAGIADTIQTAMPKQDAQKWFGIAPPDLSLIARSRGVDWLYTYLLSFYRDDSRPLGVNNLLFNETAMPDVLVNLRGDVLPFYRTEVVGLNGEKQAVQTIDHLFLEKQGAMTTQQFDVAMTDLVNFLVYVSEPVKQERKKTGYGVLGFLIIFAVLAYLLKREYWKDIH
jgi:ubiquinol-cytochrome c reductase cytochrome c1 subunit